MFSEIVKKIRALSSFKNNMKNTYRLTPVKLSLTYFGLSFLWILFSDRIANSLVLDKNTLTSVSTYKGWVYVAVITFILYWLLSRDFKKMELSERKLIESYEELSATHEELEAANEELTASDEELKQQFDEIMEYNKYVKISEDRLNRAQELAHVGNWELDITNKKVWASAETLRIYGLKQDSQYLSLEKTQEVVHVDDKEEKAAAFQLLLEGKEDYDVIFRIIRADDGQERVIHSFSALENSAIESGKRLGVVQDITDLYKSEQNLRAAHEALKIKDKELEKRYQELQAHKDSLIASEERFRNVLEFSQDAYYRRNLITGKFDYLSPVIERVTGYTADDLMGMDFDTLMGLNHPDDCPDLLKSFKESYTQEHVPFSIEYRFLCKDGQYRWLLERFTTVLNESSQPLFRYGCVQDVTERKLAETELKKAKEEAEIANKVKSQFLANMSHEIRTPMNGLLGMIQLAQMAGTRVEREECLLLARKSGDILLTVINDILDYSKIEAGKMSIKKVEFNVREVIGEVIALFEANIKSKGIKLYVNLDYGIPLKLSGDSIRLRQVLTNLAGNAIKFTKEGQITVDVSVGDVDSAVTQLIFLVEDTGVGISHDKLCYLFNSFSQLDESYSKEYAGTGLGLVISKRIVELMGGSIWVESAVGVGSKFYFQLPFDNISEDVNTAEQEGTNKTDINNYEDISILIVEDDLINRMVVNKYLQRKGFTIFLAENGIEAIKKYKERNHDIVLMDIQMPIMDGMEATSIIRALESETSDHTPIIALTAFAQESDRQKFIEGGFDGYLSKPLDLEQLFKIIVEWAITKQKE